MATVAQFSVCQDAKTCSSLTFNDTTGAYSATNLEGYGSPNETISGATATLAVTLASGDIYTIALGGFPTTDKELEFIISATDLGYASNEKIADQIMSFTYTVTYASGNVITQTKAIAFYCQATCCVNSMFFDYDVNCMDCIRESEARSRKAWTLLQGLKHSSLSADTTTFNKTLAQLNKLCLNSECSNCK